MTNPLNIATTESLWEEKQLLLLKEGATKTVLIGLFSYCLLGTLTLRYYNTEMLLSPYIFISIITPLILLASWFAANKMKNSFILAYGNSVGLISCNAVISALTLSERSLGPLILSNIPIFIIPALLLVWKSKHMLILLIYGLLVNFVLFELFSPFSANDILRWWPIALAICISAYFLVENKYKGAKGYFVLNQNLKNKQKELEAEIDTKNKLFSIIAHDLRSPIGNLYTLLELASEFSVQGDKENLDTFLKVAKASSKSSFELLDNLLKWAQAQLNAIKVELLEVNLLEKAEKVIGIYANQISEKQLEVKTQIKKEDVVLADKPVLQTVIRNIMSNAIKFSPEKGVIVIHYEDKVLSIRDQGEGMTKEKASALLSGNFNNSSRGTNGEQGTGLGLSLANDLMRKMGGEIRVESRPNEGASFQLVFK
ncbi:HAMP domain-containing sensor histidine kinase [Cyclobacterium sp. 1_MG-2023]|uniref:sensor histidine kinase n=1 Tax=Cyclobacterium sp. 1_MG-2023 TaxID=3062681 RepID=UPI0026E36D0C|nr:HAMP domain-containing sensor histidine kinase [Cyclobacterium sp. 1_MG-2023]MDO6438913.1 HAMP domain-containing sensor histidine kinase [Cyclobacterium sp. 1_MG-2023]